MAVLSGCIAFFEWEEMVVEGRLKKVSMNKKFIEVVRVLKGFVLIRTAQA